MTPEECIELIHGWLLGMSPRTIDAVEDAIGELRVHIARADAQNAPRLAAKIAEAAALAGSAHLLWGGAAALSNCAGPAYSSSGTPCDARVRDAVQL